MEGWAGFEGEGIVVPGTAAACLGALSVGRFGKGASTRGTFEKLCRTLVGGQKHNAASGWLSTVPRDRCPRPSRGGCFRRLPFGLRWSVHGGRIRRRDGFGLAPGAGRAKNPRWFHAD